MWPEPAPGSVQSSFVLRHFLLELIYLIFCNASGYYVHADWLIYLADLDLLDMYDWGGVSYACLAGTMLVHKLVPPPYGKP